jgi:hypothetical protein
MKAYVGVDVYIHIFLISALAGGEWSASLTGRFIPGEKTASPHLIGWSVGPRAFLDAVENRKILPLPRIEPWSSSP